MSDNKKSEFFEPYANFSKLLRTWLVSYGIGAIFFISSQSVISTVLQEHKETSKYIISLLISGLVIQVVAAFLYKYSMLYLYHGETDTKLQNSLRYKIADKLSEFILLEMLFDIFSIIIFSYATYLIATVALKI